MNRIVTVPNPVLFDKVIGDIQQGLADNVPWLNHIFGRAERLVKTIQGKRVYSPNVYVGGNEYRLITPDDIQLGNYCFFVLDDPQTISWMPGEQSNYKVPFSIIFWFDMRKVTGSINDRDLDVIKIQLMKVLNGGFWLKSGSYKINQIYERAENVFKGYTLDEIDNQYLMHPFAGLRFEGIMSKSETCDNL